MISARGSSVLYMAEAHQSTSALLVAKKIPLADLGSCRGHFFGRDLREFSTALRDSVFLIKLRHTAVMNENIAKPFLGPRRIKSRATCCCRADISMLRGRNPAGGYF
jgi:hypothetical protein